ncbi:hypothetical protein MEQU1_001972 [Malassezia equina]|uniref:Uncharacterized protein n=1 Tax=Malassezia equina TaxID=1381935 RepID=A0AAF0EF69_9BASI|nr:hypothetical protein MEQU1_001972 [Malassezia equina]
MELAMNRWLDQGSTEMAPPVSSGAAPPPTFDKALVPSHTELPSWQDTQDEDLQRACAASMEEQIHPAKAGEDDEDMMRALAQSVHDQVPTAGSAARPDLHRLRTNTPVALVPSVSVYRVASLFLQALLAAPAACDAFLSYSAPDNRARSGEDRAWPDVPMPRATVVTGDIEAIIPPEVVLQASRNEALHRQLETYANAIVWAWQEARAWEAEQITQATRSPTDAARAQLISSKATVFRTYAATAYDEPMPDMPCPEGQPTTTITLAHTAFERSVPSCLWQKLAASDRMDSLLITQASDVLLFNVERPGATEMFRIDPVLYLDPFLWSKRQGQRIDGTDECRQLQSTMSELRALKAQWKTLTEPTSTPIDPLLERVSEHYASQNEAMHSWVQRIQHHVQQQRADLQRQQQALQSHMEVLRRRLADQVEQEAQKPDQHAHPYDLCAAIVAHGDGECVYVRYEDAWWCIDNGTVTTVRRDMLTQCSIDTWITDSRGADQGMGLVHLVYQRRGLHLSHTRPDMTALQQAIAQDNERAQSEVAQEE